MRRESLAQLKVLLRRGQRWKRIKTNLEDSWVLVPCLHLNRFSRPKPHPVPTLRPSSFHQAPHTRKSSLLFEDDADWFLRTHEGILQPSLPQINPSNVDVQCARLFERCKSDSDRSPLIQEIHPNNPDTDPEQLIGGEGNPHMPKLKTCPETL